MQRTTLPRRKPKTDIVGLRDEFPITRSKVFLNHAAQSPLPKPVVDAMRDFIEEFSATGTTKGDINEPKRLFTRLVGAGTHEEVAFVENTSMGLNIVANMLNPKPGSNVVTTDLEYPSVVYPWLDLENELRFVMLRT